MQVCLKTIKFFTVLLFIGLICSCNKLVEIPAPIDTITTTQVFSSDKKAEAAMVGVYGRMINGNGNIGNMATVWQQVFSAGLTTILAGLSSDELFYYRGAPGGNFHYFNTNKLTLTNSVIADPAWKTAYIAIYGANSVIEGIAASTSSQLSNHARELLTAEAKFARAFCYFTLTNLYGQVPIVLTVDFNKTINLPAAPQEAVYKQIIQDLKDAQAALPPDYSNAKDERVRPNKWAATALLARAYLFTKDYTNAAAEATKVIEHHLLYNLEPDLNNVFLANSREAIWQLQQTTLSGVIRNATPEGFALLPQKLDNKASAPFCLSTSLLNAFETGDQRLIKWVGMTDNSSAGASTGITYYPYKYKIGNSNSSQGDPAIEYQMVLRLAEQYLIRAEAVVNGPAKDIPAAIADLNRIRDRADLDDLPVTLTLAETLAAIAKERQLELFAEWGHRWMDLKRTGKAEEVLSVVPLKQPWAGNYQLLYPIPQSELEADPFLIQNPDYR